MIVLTNLWPKSVDLIFLRPQCCKSRILEDSTNNCIILPRKARSEDYPGVLLGVANFWGRWEKKMRIFSFVFKVNIFNRNDFQYRYFSNITKQFFHLRCNGTVVEGRFVWGPKIHVHFFFPTSFHCIKNYQLFTISSASTLLGLPKLFRCCREGKLGIILGNLHCASGTSQWSTQLYLMEKTQCLQHCYQTSALPPSHHGWWK